jgi:hypothetical protein
MKLLLLLLLMVVMILSLTYLLLRLLLLFVIILILSILKICSSSAQRGSTQMQLSHLHIYQEQGVQKLMGDDLKVAWAAFSTLS